MLTEGWQRCFNVSLGFSDNSYLVNLLMSYLAITNNIYRTLVLIANKNLPQTI